MRRRVTIAVLLGTLAPSAASAGPEVSRFRWEREVDVAGADGLVRVRVPVGLYAQARGDLADLRLVDDRGAEVPYLLRTEDPASVETLLEVDLQDHAIAPEGVQFTVDLGPGRRRHSRLRIWTRSHDFRRTVLLEVSQDRESWVAVRQRAYIFDFSVEPGRHADLLDVDYPVSTLRYLRATVFDDGGPPIAVTRAAVLLAETKEEVLHHVWHESFDRSVDAESRATVLEIDIGRSGVPHDRVEIVTGDVDFHRAVDVESRAKPDDRWTYVASGVVYRIRVDDQVDERATVTFPEIRDRHLRVVVHNRDDRPLEVENVEVRGRARTLLFRAAKDRSYRLLHGYPRGRAPSYDLAQILARQSRVDSTLATIGVARRNPAFRPPPPPTPPLTDRYPVLFYVVLGGAVVVLGWITLRLMRKASGGSTE